MKATRVGLVASIIIITLAASSEAAPQQQRRKPVKPRTTRSRALPIDAAPVLPKPRVYVDPNVPPPPPVAAPAPDFGLVWGIHAGMNLANLAVSPKSDMSSHTGLMLGGTLEAKLHPMFYAETGLFYVQKGGTLNEEYQLRPKDTSISLAYLEIPVLVKSKFDFEYFRLFALVGPAFSIRVSGSSEVSIPGYDTVDARIGLGGTDLGLIFGGGFEVPVTQKASMVFNARYELGLSNIGDHTAASYKNRGAQFMLGSLFQF